MGTSLIAICNSTTLEVNTATAETFLSKFKSLSLTRAVNSDGTIDQADWEYSICDFNNRLRIEFESGTRFAPVVYNSISEISTILKINVLYDNFKLDWFQDFRKELFSIVQILGGTEILYMADNGHPLDEIYDKVGEDGVTYQDIKAMLQEQFGPPITDYSKLSLDDSHSIPREYFLDEFNDLHAQD